MSLSRSISPWEFSAPCASSANTSGSQPDPSCEALMSNNLSSPPSASPPVTWDGSWNPEISSNTHLGIGEAGLEQMGAPSPPSKSYGTDIVATALSLSGIQTGVVMDDSFFEDTQAECTPSKNVCCGTDIVATALSLSGIQTGVVMDDSFLEDTQAECNHPCVFALQQRLSWAKPHVCYFIVE